MRLALALIVLPLVVGCGEDLDPASLITKTRSIAARVRVIGEPERANPNPEESVSVEVRVVGPGPRQPLQWLFIACIPADVGFGPPVCAGTESIIEPCIGCESDEGLITDPIIEFEVPSESDLGDADSVVAFGAICADGPVLSFEEFVAFFEEGREGISACEDPDDEGSLLFVDIPLQEGEPDNTQPTIAQVSLGGSPWTDFAPPEAGVDQCDDTPIPQLPPGTGPIAIGLTAEPGSRQEFTDPNTEELVCEELLISWLGTDGEFDESFGFIDEEMCTSPEDSNGSATVGWMPPEQAESGGTLVRFHFVLRDGRGGTDWTERALCIVP